MTGQSVKVGVDSSLDIELEGIKYIWNFSKKKLGMGFTRILILQYLSYQQQQSNTLCYGKGHILTIHILSMQDS